MKLKISENQASKLNLNLKMVWLAATSLWHPFLQAVCKPLSEWHCVQCVPAYMHGMNAMNGMNAHAWHMNGMRTCVLASR